jgi:alkylation response protein AidB-like acyl-CoA dehydrogenase
MGFFGISYPEAYGGLNLFYTVIFLEELQKNKNLVCCCNVGSCYLAMTHLNAKVRRIKQDYLAQV